MEETLNMTQPEVTEEITDTTPVPEEDTTDAAEGTPATPEGENAEVTAEADETNGNAPEETPAAPFLTVKYNKQQKDLSQDEAITLAQKGMKWNDFIPVYNQIKMLADSTGQSVPDFVKQLGKSQEAVELRRLVSQLGEDKQELAKEIIKSRAAERMAKFKGIEVEEQEAADAEKAGQEAVLASQFGELQAEFPEYTSFDKVPNAVLRLAEDKGISLLDAQLRYQRSESRRIEKAAQKQQEAAKASTGSVKSAPENKQEANAVFAAFDRAFGR